MSKLLYPLPFALILLSIRCANDDGSDTATGGRTNTGGSATTGGSSSGGSSGTDTGGSGGQSGAGGSATTGGSTGDGGAETGGSAGTMDPGGAGGDGSGGEGASGGAGACDPASSDGVCTACLKSECCDQWVACQSDVDCQACNACLDTELDLGACATMTLCDIMPPATSSMLLCAYTQCQSECGLD